MKCTQRICGCVAAVVFAASPLVVTAQQIPQGQRQAGQPQSPPAQAEIQVVATVDGDPITQQEVQASLQPRLQGRQVDPQTAAQMQKQVIDTLIDSRLVEQYVLEHGPGVQDQEVKEAVGQLEEQLQSQQVSLDEFLAARGYTEEMLQDRIEGSLAWQKFQQQQVTDENLQRFFQQNQQAFQAENFEQARPQVANAYISQLWEDIVGQMKPKAEIRGGGAPEGATPQLGGAPPQQRQPPRGQ